MNKQTEAMKRWVEVFDGNWHDEPVDSEWADRAHQALAEMRQAIAEAEQPAQQQEPVAWICEGSSSDEKHAIDYWPGDVDDIPIGTKLYTSPPAQRTWVGLTDDDWDDIFGDAMTIGEAIKATEAKLKEKNT